MPLTRRLFSVHGWRRGAMLAGLALLAVLIVAGVYVTRPHRLADLTAHVLERVTGAIIEIDRAYLSLDGSLQLEGVRFGVPDLPPELARLGDIGSVRVIPDIWALGRGEFAVRSIVLLEPTLHLTRDAEDDRYNYQHLLRPSDEPGQQWLIDALPEIFVRGGRLSFAEVDASGAIAMGVMNIEGRLIRDPAEPAGYRFTLHQQGEQLLPGVVLHGSIDLLHQRISTSLHGFEFTQQQQQLLPEPLRHLWTWLDPAGEMPEITLTYDALATHGLEAELRVHDVAMSIPVPGINSRLRNVTALLRLRGDRLHIESLTGDIEGIACHVEGEIDPFNLDAPMRLKLVTDPFDIRESPPPYLAGLPPMVQRHYARFQPTGRFQTTFELRRDQDAGPLQYEGTINVLGASGRYEKFPVPAHDFHGQVHITHEQVRIENMRGRSSTGAEVLVQGTITPPGREPAVNLHVRVRGGSVDEHLMAALKPDERRIIHMFMHEPSRARLIDAGLIQDLPPMIPQWRERLRATLLEGTAPPTFAFNGRMHVDVHIDREQGPADAKVEVLVQPAGPVPLLFKHWAYPVYMTAGRVIVGPDTVRVDDLEFRGLTGGQGKLAGDVQHSDGDVRPDIVVEHASLPIDPLLFASISTPQDRWIRELGIVGQLDATGLITSDDHGKPDFSITLNLDQGQANPYHGDFTFTDVDSQLLLHRDHAELRHFTGHRGQGRIVGHGTLDWADGELETDLTFTGDAITLEPALLDLLPPDHAGRERGRAMFDRYQPAGIVDAELYLGTEAGPDATALTDDAPPYRLVVRPRTIDLTAAGETFSLRDITGSITVAAEQAELDEFTASFDAGRLTATGLVMLDETGGMALQFTGDLDNLAGSWTALLPEPVSRTLEALDIRGRARVDHLRLLARPHADEGPTLESVGQLTLRDTQLNVGLPIDALYGQVAFEVERRADESLPRFNMQLDADRLLARDREITALALALYSDHETQAIRIEQLRGQVYGGMLVGGGVFDLKSDAGYHVELGLQDVRLDPFLAAPEVRRAEEEAQQNGSEPSAPPRFADDAGRLNASLTLNGELNDASSRRGRGAVEVRQARLYERPVALALLQAVNLSLPLAGSFDRGTASFLLEGETVYFDNLLLEAPSVAIHGTGTMHYPTGSLDLNLRGRNPVGPDLGVISDVFKLVKDQLVAIHITGTMDEPRARVVGLEDLRRPWTDAFNAEQ